MKGQGMTGHQLLLEKMEQQRMFHVGYCCFTTKRERTMTSVTARQASQSTNDECSIRALVQTCSYWQALGTPEEHKEKMYDTTLLSRHALAATWVASTIGSPAHNLPRIDSVPVESIQDNLIVVEEMPGLVESWQGTRYVWLARNRKLEWPNMFRIGP
jgi:hypothetical protein